MNLLERSRFAADGLNVARKFADAGRVPFETGQKNGTT